MNKILSLSMVLFCGFISYAPVAFSGVSTNYNDFVARAASACINVLEQNTELTNRVKEAISTGKFSSQKYHSAVRVISACGDIDLVNRALQEAELEHNENLQQFRQELTSRQAVFDRWESVGSSGDGLSRKAILADLYINGSFSEPTRDSQLNMILERHTFDNDDFIINQAKIAIDQIKAFNIQLTNNLAENFGDLQDRILNTGQEDSGELKKSFLNIILSSKDFEAVSVKKRIDLIEKVLILTPEEEDLSEIVLTYALDGLASEVSLFDSNEERADFLIATMSKISDPDRLFQIAEQTPLNRFTWPIKIIGNDAEVTDELTEFINVTRDARKLARAIPIYFFASRDDEENFSQTAVSLVIERLQSVVKSDDNSVANIIIKKIENRFNRRRPFVRSERLERLSGDTSALVDALSDISLTSAQQNRLLELVAAGNMQRDQNTADVIENGFYPIMRVLSRNVKQSTQREYIKRLSELVTSQNPLSNSGLNRFELDTGDHEKIIYDSCERSVKEESLGELLQFCKSDLISFLRNNKTTEWQDNLLFRLGELSL